MPARERRVGLLHVAAVRLSAAQPPSDCARPSRA